MPKLRPSVEEQRNRAILGIIAKYQMIGAYTDQQVAAKGGIAPRTYSKRKNNPGGFSVEELSGICNALKVPPEERALMI
ncbi:MAG: helix-turn-helix transcriptional regulator [Lachnospiraceae bacterium]